MRTESAGSFVRHRGRMPLKANKIVWGIKKKRRYVRIDVIGDAVIGELKRTQMIGILPGPSEM